MLHAFMLAIGSVGEEYGLQFNWKKLEMMPVRVDAVIQKPDGERVERKDQLVYLGSSLSSDGRVGPELSCRLGLARADYENLRKKWSHSALSVRRKVAIFEACVVTKLLYSLTSACLNKCERRGIDGFQARCLRKIMKVAPACWSRVANKTVLARASTRPVSQQLLKDQLIYFGRIASRNPTDPVRDSILKREGMELRELQETRRVGRPRLEWSKEIFKHAVEAAGSHANLRSIFSNENSADIRTSWRGLVSTYVGTI